MIERSRTRFLDGDRQLRLIGSRFGLMTLAEAILLTLVLLAPWAYGAVEARALLVLAVGVTLLTFLHALSVDPRRFAANFLSVPSLVLLGLMLLGLGQTRSLSVSVLKLAAPGTAALRAAVVPEAPERARSDDQSPPSLPPACVSEEPEATFDMIVRLFALWLLFQASLGVAANQGSLRRFGVALTVNAAALALFSLVQALSWNGKIYWVRPSMAGAGPFANHNHLAAWLNLGLGFAIGRLLEPASNHGGERTRGAKLWPAYAVSLITIGVLASLSRSGFVSMLIVSGVLIALIRPRGSQYAVAGVGLLTLVAVFLVMLGDTLPYYQRLLSMFNSSGEAYSDRLGIWKCALLAWKDNPLLGSGLGCFGTAVSRYTTIDAGTFYARAEDEYLDMLVEGGLVGLGLVVVLLAGLSRGAQRAWNTWDGLTDRVSLASAISGFAAIAIQSFTDFAFHIPAVTLVVVVLSAHLWNAGRAEPRGGVAWPWRWLTLATGLLLTAASLILVLHEQRGARAEAALMEAGIPLPGLTMPVPSEGIQLDGERLLAQKAALQTALVARPDWAEGHVRLGLVHLRRYRIEAADWIRQTGNDDQLAQIFSDPLWLLSKVRRAGEAGVDLAAELIRYDPVRSNLIPALRCFQEGRRCAFPNALAEAEMGSLVFLFEGNVSGSSYVERALTLAGADEPLLIFNASVARQLDETEVAVACWRKALEVRGLAWTEVADAAALALTPEEILAQVVPDGRFAVLFGDRLYDSETSGEAQQLFMRKALALLPVDPLLSQTERNYFEARAHAALGDRQLARDRMVAALGREPLHLAWREELIGWLVRWGQIKEAHDQAVLAVHFHPNEPRAQQILERVNEVRAQTPSEH